METELPWPGPFETNLPSGDRVTVTLGLDSDGNFMLVVDNPRLATHSDDELGTAVLSKVSEEDRDRLTELAGSAMVRFGELKTELAGKDLVRVVGYNPCAISLRPGRARSSGFVPVKPA